MIAIPAGTGRPAGPGRTHTARTAHSGATVFRSTVAPLWGCA
jgi:hypothetical protein